MEKEYGEIYYVDFKELISDRRKPSEEQHEFIRTYMSKLGVDIEQNPFVVIWPSDPKTLGYLILDIITDFEQAQK